MSDNITASYLAAKRQREQPQVDATLARLEALEASRPKPQPATPQAAPAKPAEEPRTTTVKEAVTDTPRAIAHAAADLFDSVNNMVNDAVNVFSTRLFDYRFGHSDVSGALESTGLAKPETFGGKAAKEILQWATPFAGALKAANTVKKATTHVQQAVRGMQAGAVADVSSFNPDNGNVSRMLVDLGEKYPALKNPLTEFLATDESNTDAENRLLAALEGAGLGAAVEGVFGLIKGGRVYTQSRKASKAPAKTPEAAPVEDLTQHAVDTKKAPDLNLREQLDALTGVGRSEADAATRQKRLDVLAAVRNADSAVPAQKAATGLDPNLMESSAGIEPVTPSAPVTLEQRNQEVINRTFIDEQLPVIEEAIQAGKARSAYWDPVESALIITREKPSPTALPLEQTVQPALAKKPHERTAEDLAAIRAYRQLQESAFRGLEIPGMPAPRDAEVALPEASAGAGKAALSDAERALMVGTSEASPVVKAVSSAIDTLTKSGVPEAELRSQVKSGIDMAVAAARDAGIDSAVVARLRRLANNAVKDASDKALSRLEAELTKVLGMVDTAAPQAADMAPSVKVGDDIAYNGGEGFGRVTRVMDNGKVVVEDAQTGAAKVVTPDTDDLAAEITQANSAFMAAMGRRANRGAYGSAFNGESGLASPTLLANIAGSFAGGLAGFSSADDDASFADRLSLAGMGALAGMGLVRVGLNRVPTAAEREALKNAPPELRSLASPEVRSIAPVGGEFKRPPVSRAGVNKMVDALKNGGVENLINTARQADFNFDNIDTEVDVENIVNAVSSVFEKEIDAAKHGVQTFEQIKELAEEVGTEPDILLRDLSQDTDNLAARALAGRAVLAASAEKVNGLARILAGTAPRPPHVTDDHLILAARKQVAIHAATQMQVKKAQTEIARALAGFRINSASLDLAEMEKSALIEAMGGHKANKEFVMKLSMVNDPKRLAAIMRKGALARHQDALFHSWVAGIMSGPTTQIVNATGSVLTSLGAIGERLGGAAFSAMRGAEDGVTMGEVHAFLFGMKQGFTVATRITSEAIRTSAASLARGDLKGAGRAFEGQGTAYQAFAKDAPILDNATYGTRGDIIGYQNPIQADYLGYDPKSLIGRVVDAYGTLVSVVGRGMSFTDELFKSVHYYGELNAQAYRTARAEGLPDEAIAARVAQLIDEPTQEMAQQAMKSAREGTFTSPLGKSGASFQNFVASTPGMRYVFPFVRTPLSIMKYVGRRSPLGFASEAIQAELKAGGASRDIALAKMSVGTSIMLAAGWAASEGILTGGGELDQTAENLGGWQPYSLKVGDTYISLRRLDPLAMHLGMAADIVDISGHTDEDDTGELVGAVMLSMYRNLVSKSYLSGAVQLIDAFEEGRRGNVKAVGVYVANQASSFLPMTGALNTVRKADDPVTRDAQTIIERVKSRIPGLSSELPPVLNVFGEEVPLKGGWGPDLVSPFSTTQEATLPAAKEIARLNLDLRNPPRRLGSPNGGPGVDLSLKQYHRLMQLVGQNFKPAVTELVASPEYNSLPEDPTQSRYPNGKEIVISRMYAQAKQAATAQLLSEDAELMQAVMSDRQNAMNAIFGVPVQ